MAESSHGVSVPLSADVRKALADLQQVIDKAREARSATDGLPSPDGQARPSNHPLVDPMPRAQIPGGKAVDMRRPGTATPSTLAAETPAMKVAAERGYQPPSPAMRAAGNAATATAMHLPPAPIPSPAAASAAGTMAAQGSAEQGLRNVFAPRLTAGGPKLGPVGLNNLSAGSAMTQALRATGPAAGYLAAAHAGLKVAGEASSFTADLVIEAAETNSTVDEVFFRNAPSMVQRLAYKMGGSFASVIGELEKVSGPLRRHWGDLATIVTGDPEWRQMADAASASVADFMETISGVKAQRNAERKARVSAAQEQYDRTMAELKAKAEQMTRENQQRVANQLIGLGFPGTFEQWRNNPVVKDTLDELSNEATSEARMAAQREYNRLTIGKQE